MNAFRCLGIMLLALTVPTQGYGQQPTEPVTIGTPGLTPPRLTNQITVDYPAIAQSARIGGTVVVEAIVDVSGAVQRTQVVLQSESPLLLDKGALEAVRRMQFAPGILDGIPVPVTVPVTFRFSVGVGAPRPPSTSPQASAVSWVPADFAVAYEYQCPVFEFTIDTSRGRFLRSGPSGITVERLIDLGRADLEAIFLRLVRAGFFLIDDGVTMWRDPGTDVVEGELGVEVWVAGEIGRIRTVTIHAPARRSFLHELDVRYFGVWRRIAWTEPLRGDQAVEMSDLSAVGAMIRQIVERQEAIKALPRDQRSCG